MMIERFPFMLLSALALGIAAETGAQLQQQCSATGVMGGKKFSMTHCAVSFYEGENSVTLWLAEAPISAEDAKAFEFNAYPKEKDASGKRRTALHLSFCPGGGKPMASPAAVKSVELGMDYADSPMLGRQWVIELPKEKDLKVEKLSGDIKLGGRLTGRITGTRSGEKPPYSWQIDFDVRLPERSAAAGTGCGS